MKCPNEGDDRRALHWLICPLQWLCSWHSEKEPELFWFNGATWTAFSLWPPYLVSNWPVSIHHQLSGPYWVVNAWRMFRIGWRFDKNWMDEKTGRKGGYIGPSAAFKIVSEPLLFF